MNKVAVRIVVVLVIGAALGLAAVAYQSERKARLGRTLLSEFKADLVAQVDLDPASRTYAEGLADQFHDDAYDGSFGAEAPALGGTTDVNTYQRSLLSAMIDRAAHDGRPAIVRALEQFKLNNTKLDLHEAGGAG